MTNMMNTANVMNTTNEPRVPRTEITGLYGGVLKRAMRRMLGSVSTGAEVMWHYPTVFKDSMKFGRRLDKWHRLDRTLATLATMSAAATVGCSFCLDLHYFLSRNSDLSVAKARGVPRWRDCDVYTPLERRVMDYAEAMCQTPVAVTDEMVAALLPDLGPDGVVELTARVGVMNMTARGNVALGIRSEHYAEACGLPPLPARPDNTRIRP